MKKELLGKALACAGAMGLLILGGGRAEAALIVLAPSITAAAGSSGAFDIVLQNTGGASVSIGGFSFGISTTNAGILFTGATIFTVPTYIFAGDSINGPGPLVFTTSSGMSLIASDNPLLATSFPVAAGATVGLGHVSYSISAGAASGPFAITLTPAATSLSSAAGANIPITTLTNGSLTVTATPEPASMGMFGMFVLASGLIAKRRRQRSLLMPS